MITPIVDGKVLTLADTVPGKKYRILRINGGRRLNSRLFAMGLVPNETFYVSNESRGGPVRISIKGSIFAIGKGMANKIVVREMNNRKKY